MFEIPRRPLVISAALFTAASILFTQGCTRVSRSQPDLPKHAPEAGLHEELDDIFFLPKFSNAHWGVRVETLGGEVVYDHQGEKSFVPASNLKLFTTPAALERLGPDYTYTTTVEAIGPVEDGTLRGDLVIVGSGDPSLGAWHPDENYNSTVLFEEDWIPQLREAGIERIEGDIVGDGRFFTEEYINDDWVYWDLPYWYAAGSSGLAMEENCFRTTIRPGDEVGDPARITWTPDTDYISIINDVETVEAGGTSNADIVWRNEENLFRYDRAIALDKEAINERGSVWDGTRYAAFLFREALEENGIAVGGKARNIRKMEDAARIDDAPEGERRVLITHISDPISEQCKVINEFSHNFFADQLQRTLGAEEQGEGSFDGGASAVQQWLQDIGAPEAGRFNMVDGSGLSANNMVQPRQVTYVLRYERNQGEAGEAFYNSLSRGGESGWLKDRLDDVATKGNVRAKTGYIGFARSLSGYVTDQNGQEYAFSMLCNNYSTSVSEVDEVLDEAVKKLALIGGEAAE